jgi:hypothetical protein
VLSRATSVLHCNTVEDVERLLGRIRMSVDMRFEGLSSLGLHLASFAPTLEAIAYIDHGFSFLLIPGVLNIWSRGGIV